VVEGGLAGSYLYKDEAARIGYVREGEVNEVEWSQRVERMQAHLER